MKKLLLSLVLAAGLITNLKAVRGTGIPCTTSDYCRQNAPTGSPVISCYFCSNGECVDLCG